MYSLLFVIIFFCLLMLPVYLKTGRFDRSWGILLFALGIGVLIVRIYILKEYPFLGLFNESTIYRSTLLVGTPAVAFAILGLVLSGFRRQKVLKKLIFPYIVFGGLEQVFFLLIFTDALYYLTRNVNLTFLSSVIFFTAFHLSSKSSIKKFWILLPVFGGLSAWIYLFWGNVLPQMLVHGIAGSVLFTEFTDHNEIKDRLG